MGLWACHQFGDEPSNDVARDVVPSPLGDVRPSPFGDVVVVPSPFTVVRPSPLGNVVVVPSPFADVVLSPLGMLLPVAVGDPPLMQFEVVPIEPMIRADCVLTPLQAVPGDPTNELIVPGGRVGTDTIFAVPNIGTVAATPDAGNAGIWPPPGSVVTLGATVLFGFAKADGAMLDGTIVVEARLERSGVAMDGTVF